MSSANKVLEIRCYYAPVMDLKMLLADRLKKLRAEKGWTRCELARRAGLHEKVVFKYENAMVLPNAENLKKLVSALDISADFLLFEHSRASGIPKISQPGLYDRYMILEELEKEELQAVTLLLDSLIARRKLKDIVDRT